ncbi:hypothetical protein L7F22_052524 [Adiantum nelumboides]|nr:hypothetical protein [Adiantum nelumboides]
MSMAFHPQTDGETERVDRVLEDLLRMYGSESQTNWVDCLPLVEFAYNNSWHASIQMSPFEAMYGSNCVTPLSFSDPENKVEVSKQMLEKMDLELAKIRRHIKKSQKKQKQYYDKHKRPLTFEVGDLVFLKANYNLRDDGSLKIEPEAILNRKIRQLRSKTLVEVLVKWDMYPVEDASWVDLDVLHEEYPSFQL